MASLVQLFPLLESAIGTYGMSGLDRLLGLQATALLQKIIGVMEATIFRDKGWIELLQNLSNSLNPIENVIAQVHLHIHVLELLALKSSSGLFQPFKFYHQQHLSRANRALSSLIELIGDLGQHQLLRMCIAYQLSTTANFDSKLLFSSIKAFNSYVSLPFANTKQMCQTQHKVPRAAHIMLLFTLCVLLIFNVESVNVEGLVAKTCSPDKRMGNFNMVKVEGKEERGPLATILSPLFNKKEMLFLGHIKNPTLVHNSSTLLSWSALTFLQ